MGITSFFGKNREEEAAKREAEIERAKANVRRVLESMNDASPEEAERSHKLIKDLCKADKLLPLDFKQKAQNRAKSLECDANMRKADSMAKFAETLGHAEKLKERGQWLAKARLHFSKACVLGANKEWQTAFLRLNEVIMMTGGLKKNGPSRAKPLDTAPKAPNRAKAW